MATIDLLAALCLLLIVFMISIAITFMIKQLKQIDAKKDLADPSDPPRGGCVTSNYEKYSDIPSDYAGVILPSESRSDLTRIDESINKKDKK